MEADGFSWWVRRIAGAGELFDRIRIDHFRGIESYFAVPYGETSAQNGHWVKGPGIRLVDTLKERFPQLDFIAEDLGYSTPEVRQLLKEFNLTPNVDSFRATLVTALAAYSAAPSDDTWDGVVKAFVDGWAYEYGVENN